MDYLKEFSDFFKGKIECQNLLNVNFKEISTRRLVVKSYRDFKLEINEFGSLCSIGITAESDFFFSINKPDRVLFVDKSINISDFPYKVYVRNENNNPFLNINFIEFWKVFSDKIIDFKLNENECIYFHRNRIIFVLSSYRELIPIINEYIDIIKKNDSIFKKHNKNIIFKKNIPDVLRQLTPLLKKWAIADDGERDKLIEEATQQQKKQLIKKVEPLFNEINCFLESFNDRPLSYEAILLGNLAELVSELLVQN
jgi:hypothetical protein